MTQQIYRALYYCKEKNLYRIDTSSFKAFAQVKIIASEGTWVLLGFR